jgi:hypothetical protein
MSDDRYEPVEFEGVTVKVARERALLCDVEGKAVWIPISQIHDDSEVYKADTEGKLIIPQWLAEEKGLV